MNIDKETIQALKERAKEMLNNDYSRKIGDEEIHTIICEWENTLSELEIYKKIAMRLAKEILSIHHPMFNMVTVKNMEILIENARKEVENES